MITLPTTRGTVIRYSTYFGGVSLFGSALLDYSPDREDTEELVWYVAGFCTTRTHAEMQELLEGLDTQIEVL